MPPFALLSIGQNHVIVRNFYVSTLPEKRLLAAGHSLVEVVVETGFYD
jgi:hypothetical protein